MFGYLNIFEIYTVSETTYYIYSRDMLTRTEKRCEKPAFLVLLSLKYRILCSFSVEIIVFELKTVYDGKIKQNHILLELKP